MHIAHVKCYKERASLVGNVIEIFLQRADLKGKVGDLWFEIFSCVKLVEQKEEYIEDFAQRIKSFKEELFFKDSHEKSIDKGKEIETLIGCPIPSKVSVLNPNISKNKGRQKRIQGKMEEATEKREKPLRRCRACREHSYHDSRNCKNKKVD
ncbi:hypothetical protein BVRB_4g084010 [Beta vulgaris subsp. vulgaris]|nr:hypothetical protein BVRB_4g084010 [Beta vulgaris subsp. vulgaris]